MVRCCHRLRRLEENRKLHFSVVQAWARPPRQMGRRCQGLAAEQSLWPHSAGAVSNGPEAPFISDVVTDSQKVPDKTENRLPLILTIIKFLGISGCAETLQKILRVCRTVAHGEACHSHGCIPDPSQLKLSPLSAWRCPRCPLCHPGSPAPPRTPGWTSTEEAGSWQGHGPSSEVLLTILATVGFKQKPSLKSSRFGHCVEAKLKG